MTDSHLPAGAAFALCLTHDVDRTRKTYQAVHEALRGRSLSPLRSLVADEPAYWQFPTILRLESSLGVRSAFYFLDQPSQFAVRSLGEMADLRRLTDHFGRYDVTSSPLRPLVRQLIAGGWEVGVHGSPTAARDEGRLRREIRTIESVTGRPVRGGRHHYLTLDVPRTWQYQAAAGLRYDATLGSSSTYGFEHGHRPLQPFDDDFVVFPLTAMEIALPDPGADFAAARSACEGLLAEAADAGAVATVLWHQRYFNDREFPGYRRLYRHLVESALDRGAWVGPPGDLYDAVYCDGQPTTASPC